MTLTLLLAACGPKGGDTDATGSGDPSMTGGGSSTVDAPTTGDTVDAPTAGDTGEAPTTGDTLCEVPGVSVGPPVEIKIRNAGAARVFVDLVFGCFSASPFAVVGADMSPLKLDLEVFEFTCAEAAGNRCGVDPGCPVVGQVTQIEPGATFVTTWSGGFFAPAALSEACADLLCGGCWTEQQAPTGAYTLRITSATELQGCDPECTPCEPDADGVCTTVGARVDGTVVEAVLDYPAQPSIDLVIP